MYLIRIIWIRELPKKVLVLLQVSGSFRSIKTVYLQDSESSERIEYSIIMIRKDPKWIKLMI